WGGYGRMKEGVQGGGVAPCPGGMHPPVRASCEFTSRRYAASAADACTAIISAIPAKVSTLDHVGHGLAGRIQQARVLPDRGWMQVDHHRSRRQEAGERKSRVHAAPVEGQPVAGMIRRGRQTDQELCFGARRDQQLHDALADDRVLAEQGREFAQEPFRTRRSMIFSPSRKGVDELAYGLGDLVCPFLVEKPHDTNSPHSAANARRAAPFRTSK